ncbi:hypothetical protein HZH68_015805 [Vespula germanica]|uniref:Uncharacterized protein n=1 Tax=Vespula germanica TaxID=30212 RepID=A0A834MQT4_VESGE|nr:hypothetical protein HZH68_015805 [Vespula germanica]
MGQLIRKSRSIGTSGVRSRDLTDVASAWPEWLASQSSSRGRCDVSAREILPDDGWSSQTVIEGRTARGQEVGPSDNPD